MNQQHHETYETIKTVIDNVGHELATDMEMPTAEKLDKWVEILKWGLEELPLRKYEIMGESLREAIKNPKRQDFDRSMRYR